MTKKFEVTIQYDAYDTCTVEAQNREDAIRIARELHTGFSYIEAINVEVEEIQPEPREKFNKTPVRRPTHALRV